MDVVERGTCSLRKANMSQKLTPNNPFGPYKWQDKIEEIWAKMFVNRRRGCSNTCLDLSYGKMWTVNNHYKKT